MITRDAALEHQGRRVEVVLGTEKLIGTLRAVTPAGKVVLAAETGLEAFYDLEGVSSVADARFTCPECSTRVNRTFTDGRCADCERAYAATLPAPQESCEKCGTVPAVYSPTAKFFGCAPCLAEVGGLTGIGPEVRALTAPRHESRDAECRTLPADDPKHGPWKRAKSSYVCSACYVKTFQRPAGYGS